MATGIFDLREGGLHALRNEPRLIGARRLREKGQHEQAISMLGDLLMSATDGTDGEQQLSLCLGPVYFEYGCALACARRKEEAVEADQEEGLEDDAPPVKRAKLDHDDDKEEDEKAQDDDDEGQDNAAEEDEDDDDEGQDNAAEEDEEDDDDDLKLAWKMLDQARCIYEKELESEDKTEHREVLSELARCSLMLGDINRDDEAWGDAVWEYSNCADKYESRGAPYNDLEEQRIVYALAGAAGAYSQHGTRSDLIAGADILIAKASEIAGLANSFYERARTRFEALLLRHKQMSAEDDLKTKMELSSLAIELQDVLDRVSSLSSKTEEICPD